MVPPRIFISALTQSSSNEWTIVVRALRELHAMNRIHVNIVDHLNCEDNLQCAELAKTIARSDLVLFVRADQTETDAPSRRIAILKCLELALELGKPVHAFVAENCQLGVAERFGSSSQAAVCKELNQVVLAPLIRFDATVAGDLAQKVGDTIRVYTDGFNSVKTALTLALLDIYDELVSRFTDLEFVRTQRDYDNQLRIEFGDDYAIPRALMTFAHAALCHFERRTAGEVDLAGEWLDKVWLYTLSPLPPWQKSDLANAPSHLPGMIWEWVETAKYTWFSSLRSAQQALVVNWCIERGLVFGYSGDVVAELKLMVFAKNLAEHEQWNIGNKGEQTRARFNATYLSCRSSAAQNNKGETEVVPTVSLLTDIP